MHTLIFVLTFFFTSILFSQSAGYTLPSLGYGYADLEPIIDSQTMRIHYTKHHQAYVSNLNKALEKDSVKPRLEELMKSISKYPMSVRNNGGGHYNHSLFWTLLSLNKNSKPSPELLTSIEKNFGGLDSLILKMNDAGMKHFGSGWVWLSKTKDNELFISTTANQDNPLMDVAEKQGTPLIGIDLWEHAYYLNYQNKRLEYLQSIWKVINWHEVSRRYAAVMTAE